MVGGACTCTVVTKVLEEFGAGEQVVDGVESSADVLLERSVLVTSSIGEWAAEQKTSILSASVLWVTGYVREAAVF